MVNLNIIVATDSKGGIGKNNALPWHLPADLKYFKALTTGHTIIMGRKTFESIGKALPNRRNIVITRQDLKLSDAEVAHSLESAISLCNEDDDVFVIGGAEIFRLALPKANRLFITLIHHEFDTDTFLPEIERGTWKEVKREDKQPDDKNRFSYSFLTFEKAPITED
ncbi:dihydrofolate reductase [Arcticibacter tournemirensis]|uniref:Dihydrofolate reductase n=1 Tax=Arcticibacter tournemirensis TaxID=699437 RepID=A0A5M9HIV5_9SPHI|nr:dihydrofolate reductase [Arcticibacter tournemirensis]KAA8486353.1 dihydrofolate reductase [Arcticibacter tournemirensis]TQM52170.1 dihydrofolate reductase [Arcticibacter tournemirensis]